MNKTVRSDFAPPAVQILLILNIAVFIGQQLFSQMIPWGLFALWPFNSGVFMPWQLLSYGFLHADLMHILLNMYALWLFGSPLEHWLGTKRFVQYFLICILGAALIQLIVQFMTGAPPNTPTIGASGGVFGLLLAFGRLFPRQQIMLLIPPMPIEARFFVLIYGGLELLFGIHNPSGSIAHFAHLGGMFFGWLLLEFWIRQRRGRS